VAYTRFYGAHKEYLHDHQKYYVRSRLGTTLNNWKPAR